MLNMANGFSSLVFDDRPPGLLIGYPGRGGANLSFAQWWVLCERVCLTLPVRKEGFLPFHVSGDQALFNYIFDQAGQVWHVQLLHNPASIGFYCFWRKEQNFCDL